MSVILAAPLAGIILALANQAYGFVYIVPVALTVFLICFSARPTSAFSFGLKFYLFSLAFMITSFYSFSVPLERLSSLSSASALLLMLAVIMIYSGWSFFIGWTSGVILHKTSGFVLLFGLAILLSAWEELDLRPIPITPVFFFEDEALPFLNLRGWAGAFPARVIFYVLGLLPGHALLHRGRERIRTLFLLLVIIAFVWVIGASRVRTLKEKYSHHQTVYLLQGWSDSRGVNTPMGSLFDLADLSSPDDFNDLLSGVEEAGPPAWFFFGEGSFDFLEEDLSSSVRNVLDLLPERIGIIALGANRHSSQFEGTSKNSLIFSDRRSLQLSDKEILFPVGETDVPLIGGWLRETFGFTGNLRFDQGEWKPFVSGSYVFLNMNCLEGMYMDLIEGRIKKVRLLYPKHEIILLNLSNDHLLRDTPLPTMHSNLVRWNAVSLGLPLIRSNAYGYSEIIAPWGERLFRSRPGERRIFRTRVPVEKIQGRNLRKMNEPEINQTEHREKRKNNDHSDVNQRE